MSSEFLPEDNAGQRRYRLWRDLSAAAPSPAEDFVARAALNSGGQRIQPDGLNQFRSEYSSEGTAARREEPPVDEPALEEVGTPVLIPMPPPRPAVTGRAATAIAALFIVGFAAAVGIKQLQRGPTGITAQAVSTPAAPQPTDAGASASPSTPVPEQPVELPAAASASAADTLPEAANAASNAPASAGRESTDRSIAPDSDPVTNRAAGATVAQPERPAPPLTANARPPLTASPAATPAAVPAPEPPPAATNRDTPLNAATTSGSVDVAVPASVRNTPVATTGGDVPSAGVSNAPERDTRPAPLDRPVPAFSTAAVPPAPAPIASPVTTPTAAIERTLQGYQSAFSRLDVNAVRQVWPSVDQKALAKAFDQLKSEDLTLENCKVTVTGANAVAACGGKTEYVPKIGSKSPRVERHQWRISLQQVAERWVVRGVDVTAP